MWFCGQKMAHISAVLLMGKDERTQLDKFREAAREAETDDDEERFEERLKKLVKQKPKDDKDK